MLTDESGHTDNCGVCSLTKLVTAVHVSCGVRVLGVKLVILIIAVCVNKAGHCSDVSCGVRV